MYPKKMKLLDYHSLNNAEKKILLQLIIDVHTTDNSDCRELYYNKEDEFIPPEDMANIVLGGF